MFQNLRENAQVYILHKDGRFSLEHGAVIDTKFRQEYVQPTRIGEFPHFENVVDLTLNIDGDRVTLTGLPANQEITDKAINGEKIVVSCSRELMINEITIMRQRSIDVVKSVDFNKNIIACCDKMLNIINPEIAAKQQQDAELKTMKEQMTAMMNSMNILAEQNWQLMEQLGISETSTKTKEK